MTHDDLDHNLAHLRPTTPLPATGELHLLVRYNECDPQGVAHHTSYPQWLEMARIEMLRGVDATGISYRDLEAAGLFLVVARLELRYRASARFDDSIVVLTRVTGGGRARLDHTYEVWRDDGPPRGRSQLLVEASTTLACIDRTGRPRPLPDWLRADAHALPGSPAAPIELA